MIAINRDIQTIADNPISKDAKKSLLIAAKSLMQRTVRTDLHRSAVINNRLDGWVDGWMAIDRRTDGPMDRRMEMDGFGWMD